ncbi:MAG: glycosyltransferase family 4 protein [Eubacteriaceae bacterium]
MKILYFTDTYLPQINGVTNTLHKLGRYLDNNNIEYMVFAPSYTNNSINCKEKNVQRFKSVSLPAYPECRLSIPIYSNLLKLANKFKPDIIHLMTPAGLGLVGLKYAQEKGLPVVSSFTTNFDIYLKYYNLEFLNSILWNFLRWFHNSCLINYTPSQDTSNLLKSKEIRNIKISSRGINTEIFNPNHKNLRLFRKYNLKEKTTFLYVGRLAKEKDLDILIKSICKINIHYKDKVQFIITGDGPYALDLKKSTPNNVVFTGYLKGKELSSIYASCDVFVFPSSTETFGNVVLEAMASGLPVITVNSGGVKESVINGYNGFLCQQRDSDSFTQSIEKFINDASLISKMSLNARKFTLEKSWDNIFDELTDDYHTLINTIISNTKLPA